MRRIIAWRERSSGAIRGRGFLPSFVLGFILFFIVMWTVSR